MREKIETNGVPLFSNQDAAPLADGHTETTLKAELDKAFGKGYAARLDAIGLASYVTNDQIPGDVSGRFSKATNQDAAYLDAVKRGDVETLQAMVNAAAQASGLQTFTSDASNVGYKVRRTAPPKKTVKVYKAFRMRDGNLYPMFVGAKDSLPVGVWLDATEGGYHFTGENGREYIPADTGVSINIPNDAVRAELLKRGYIKKPDAKSIKVVAYRPGWHGGELPFFPQAGNKVTHNGKTLIANAPDGYPYPNVHEFDTVIAEVEMDADRDYKPEYIKTAERNADGSINKQKSGLRNLPKGGFYEYATNPLFADRPDLGKWFISGSVKINRILSQQEVNAQLDKLDVPRQLWNASKNGKFDALDLNALGHDPQFSHVNHKLLDPITYDDAGNVIPLSQRFNKASADVRYSADGSRILAYVKDGHITFVTDNISQSQDDVKGLALHEIGVHVMTLGRDTAEFNAILRDFAALRSDARVQRAWESVPADTKPHLQAEEALGYLVEQNPNMPIAKRFLAWFRAQVRRLAAPLKGAEKLRFIKMLTDLTVNDLIYMATAATRDVTSMPTAQQDTRKSSTQPTTMATNMNTAYDKDYEDAKRDGYRRLYHGSAERLSSIKDDGNSRFGGLFASADIDAAKANAYGSDAKTVHYMDVKKEDIATNSDLAEYDIRKMFEHLSDDENPITDSEYETLEDMIIWDKGVSKGVYNGNTKMSVDRISELFEVDFADADWEAQRLRGVIAKSLGFKAVEMSDEYGTSILVFPGTPIAPIGKPLNPDIRFSRKQTPAAPANRADRFKDYGKPMGHLLTFLTRDMVVDLYKTRLPELVTYQRVQDQIEADVNTMLAEADDFKNKMMHLPRKQRDILAALAHESTIAGLDPSEEVTGRVSRLQAFVDKGELDLRTIGLSASKIRLLDRIKAELEKNKIKHADLRDRYLNQLTPESQLIFTGLRDSYRALSAKVFEELENRILRMNVDPASQQAAIVELRKEYDSTMQQIYFPLARFGDYVVSGDIEIDGVPTYHVEYKEWHLQAKAAKDKMIADGYTNVTITARKAYIEQQAKTQAVSKVIVKVREMRDTGRANSLELDKLLDDINQAIIQMQPDASYRRHFMHRKNIPGYSDDFIRAYATTNKHAATHIANLRHSDAIDNSIEAMQKQVNSIKYADKTVLQEVVDHIREREELNRLAVNPAVARIAQISFLAALASLGNFIVNVTQTPKFTFPYLSGEYGFKRAGYHLSRAYGAQMFSIRRAKSLEGVGKAMDMRNRLTGDELAIFNLLHDSGKLDLTQAYDIIDAANRDTPDNPDSWWNKGMKIAALPQHTSELINRQVSALAAIRLEMERSGDTELAFFAAVQAIITTHFNYAKNNRAKIMSGSLGRLAFIFRQYAANAIYLWARTTYQSIYKDEFVDDATAEATRTSARKRVAGMLAMSMLLSGVLGLPIYLEAAVVGAGVTGFKHGGKLGAYLGVAMVAAAAMAIGDDEEKFDAEVRRLMAEYLGDKDLAEMIARGAVRGLGADIASRVNDDQLLLRRPDPGLEGEKEWQAWVEAVLGFTLGFGANVHAGIEMMQEGDVWRGLEKATPIKQARDMMIATRWAHEGVLDKKGNDLLEDSSDGGIKPHEIAMKAVGIQPARIANAYERNNAIKYEEKFLTRARGKLMDDYIEARELRRKTGDFLPLYEVNDRIRDFSLEHPAFKITQANKESAIDSRDNAKEETIEGLRLPKARAYLRDKYDY
jgi:hypothetical protein